MKYTIQQWMQEKGLFDILTEDTEKYVIVCSSCPSQKIDDKWYFIGKKEYKSITKHNKVNHSICDLCYGQFWVDEGEKG